MEQSLVAGAVRARLVRVDAHDDDELVLDALLEHGKTARVVEHGVLVVGRAGADDDELLVRLATNDRGNLGVDCLLALGALIGKRHLLLEILRDGKAPLEICRHGTSLSRIAADIPCSGLSSCGYGTCKSGDVSDL